MSEGRPKRAAEFIRSQVLNAHNPVEFVDRLAKTSRKGNRAERIKICVEIIEEVKLIEGRHGVQIMAYRQVEAVPEIVERAGKLRCAAESGIYEEQDSGVLKNRSLSIQIDLNHSLFISTSSTILVSTPRFSSFSRSTKSAPSIRSIGGAPSRVASL